MIAKQSEEYTETEKTLQTVLPLVGALVITSTTSTGIALIAFGISILITASWARSVGMGIILGTIFWLATVRFQYRCVRRAYDKTLAEFKETSR